LDTPAVTKIIGAHAVLGTMKRAAEPLGIILPNARASDGNSLSIRKHAVLSAQ
jgi:hypothetical protein